MNSQDLRGQLKTVGAIRAFIGAGCATLTLKSKKTGDRFTFKFEQPDDAEPKVTFIKVLVGPDNTSNYKYIGVTWKDSPGVFRFSHSKSKIDSMAPSVKAVSWFLTHLNHIADVDGVTMFKQMDVWHEGRCGRCGRKLTVPESISTGFGPDCAEMMWQKAKQEVA